MGDKISSEIQNFFGVVKVNQNGQIIIPAELRKKIGITSGNQLLVFISDNGEDIIITKIEKLERILQEAGFSGLKGLISK